MGVKILAEVPVKHKKRVRVVRVPGVMAAVNYANYGLIEDIQKILNSGVSDACLARTLHVHPTTLWRWKISKHCPRELITTLAIMMWAGDIRKRQADQESISQEIPEESKGPATKLRELGAD